MGNGPFPTESNDAAGEALREQGKEYGAVTGRPRRCGWFDVPAARYSARVNSLGALVVTKLDVLDNLAEIPVGIVYEYKGKTFREVPSEIDALGEVKVRYKTLPGWQQSTFGVTELSKLPGKARDYLKFLQDQVETDFALISTGPERDHTIWDESSPACRTLFGS